MNKISTKLSIASMGAASLLSSTAQGVLAATGINDIEIEKSTGFASDIGTLFNAVLSFVMVIAALMVFFYLIMGGIDWITSGGDKGKTESARNKITAAVIGLIILAASYAILQLVLNFLGFSGGINTVFDEVNTL